MNFEYITSLNKTGNFIDDLNRTDVLSIDIESDKLDPFIATLILLQIEANNNIYIFDCRLLGLDYIKYILAIVKDSNKLCLFHNAKFDIKMLAQHTGELLINVYDTMVAETLLNQGLGRLFYSYADLTKKYCGVELDKEVRSTFIDQTGPVTNDQLIYSALDVKYLKQIREAQLESIVKSYQDRVLDLEDRLLPVVASMELEGIYINAEYWKSLEVTAKEQAVIFEKKVVENLLERLDYSKYNNAYELSQTLRIPVGTKKLRKELEGISAEFSKEWLKGKFNVNSSYQMLSALHLFGVDVENTNAKTLVSSKSEDPLVSLLLSFREFEKKVSTFGESYTNYAHPITGRVHADLNQLGTYTGRFSASKPGLHQFPHEAEYRRAVEARKGWKIIGADFSQQEYRLVGAVSGEPAIINAYLAGKDMHTATASILFGVPMEAVTRAQRNFGKTFNFAVLYGSSEWGLSFNLGLKQEECGELLKVFWGGYPVLSEFKMGAEKFIVENKFSTTPLGRRRYFENKVLFESNKKYFQYISSMMREGFNHIIQGGGADITKLSMVNIFYNNPFGTDLKILLQVHDEIICECKEEIADEAVMFIKKSMEDAEQPFLGVIPAKVDYHIGDYWIKD